MRKGRVMEAHKRWWCYDCQREWLQHSAAGANPWAPEMGCPGCKSSRIEEHIYVPAFPGGDIPRVQDAEPHVKWYAEEITPDRSAAIAMSDEDALAAQWEALGRS